MKMPELLALEPEKKNAAQKIIAETLKVFKGQDLFFGRTKTYKPDDENGQPLPDERKEMVTTVNDRLAWNAKSIIEMLDLMDSKDKTNQFAIANLQLGDKVITDLPATCLLALEKRLREIRNVYDAAPTLDLSYEWKQDPQNKNKWINGPTVSYRTEKVTRGVELAKATEKHQAIIDKVVQDEKVGVFTLKITSGALHPEEKARYLSQVDKLIELTKQARMTANQVEVKKVDIGQAIFDFIHKGG